VAEHIFAYDLYGLYGNLVSKGKPLEITRFVAETQFPPLQPPLFKSHFKTNCSARFGGVAVETLPETRRWLSKNATAAKAQQLPQFAWFFTGLTFNVSFQLRITVEVCKFLTTLFY
jgi:hypothetical protein